MAEGWAGQADVREPVESRLVRRTRAGGVVYHPSVVLDEAGQRSETSGSQHAAWQRWIAGEDCVGLSEEPLPVGELMAWAVRPASGALAVFVGTVRDHAEGRDGVERIDYEAYPEGATARLHAVVAEARRRFDGLERVVAVHRLGSLGVGEASVVVVVSAPHRRSALDALSWIIDTVKVAVPIWKREHWRDGVGWSPSASRLEDLPASPASSS